MEINKLRRESPVILYSAEEGREWQRSRKRVIICERGSNRGLRKMSERVTIEFVNFIVRSSFFMIQRLK